MAEAEQGLSELEQELVEKRRRLELLDQQLLEEGSASDASSPASHLTSNSAVSNVAAEDFDISLHPSRGESSSLSDSGASSHANSPLSSRPHTTVGQTTQEKEGASSGSERVNLEQVASSPLVGSLAHPQVVASESDSSDSDGYRIAPAAVPPQPTKSKRTVTASKPHRQQDSRHDHHDRSHRAAPRDDVRSRRHDRERDKDRDRDHKKDHERDRHREHSREHSTRDREREREREPRGRDRERGREREARERDKEHKEREKDRHKERGRERVREHREREKEKEKERVSKERDREHGDGDERRVVLMKSGGHSSNHSSSSDHSRSHSRQESSTKPSLALVGEDMQQSLPLDDSSSEGSASSRSVDKDSLPMALRPITPTRFRDSTSEEEAEAEQEFLASLPTEDRPPSSPEFTPYYPALDGCRNVDEFEYLNRIEEGTYGVVYRGKEKKTGRIVALKKLKMEKEKEGFPITSLREINTLLKSKHPNVVDLEEIAVGSNMDKIFLVMEYVEHDLKALMETMKEGFLIGEVKTLLHQLLSAVHHLHDNWILHRDLKTSNLLLSHKGILKVGDFGLAREYGSPPKPYTPIVVTLWYRAPELLLGTKMYTTAVDMWSVGCIFAEFLLMKPLFQGRTEIDQIQQIFKLLGRPDEKIWPEWKQLPAVQKVTFAEQPYNFLRDKIPGTLTATGLELLNKLLTFDPKQRISADDALSHPFFREPPLPVDPSMFPTWPARSELPRQKKMSRSPKAPDGGGGVADLLSKGEDGFHLTRASHGSSKKGMGFTLKF